MNILPHDRAAYVVRTQSVGISAVVGKILRADPSRVGLIMSDATGSNSFALSNFVNDTGMLLGQPSAPTTQIYLSFRSHGSLPMSEWWAARTGGGSQLGISEILYQPTDPADFRRLAQCAADYTVQSSNFTSTTTAQRLVRRDPSRVVLTFSDNVGTIQFGGPGVVANLTNLLTIAAAYNNIILHYDEHGPLVQEEWWSVRASGTSATGVIEVLYRPGGR